MSEDIKEYIAHKAADIVNGARRKGYGDPENNFHRIALLWQAWLYARGLVLVRSKPDDLEAHQTEYVLKASDVSPFMRLMKEARLCETPNHLDSLIDLVGYTLTGAEVNGVEVPVEQEYAPTEGDPSGRYFVETEKQLSEYEEIVEKLRFQIAQQDDQIISLKMQLQQIDVLRNALATVSTNALADLGVASSGVQPIEPGMTDRT